MMSDKSFFIRFLIMIIVGSLFNPMNVLAYRFSDLYFSMTLVYGGILMAFNMVWTHEIVHYISIGKFNAYIFLIGIILSILVTIFLLRGQYGVNDKQWLKRMISHHSTALTTTNIVLKRTTDPKIKKLGENIVKTQEKEIKLMKSYL